MRIGCLGGEKIVFCQERYEKVRSDFTLKLFKEIVARWIEDLWRSVDH